MSSLTTDRRLKTEDKGDGGCPCPSSCWCSLLTWGQDSPEANVVVGVGRGVVVAMGTARGLVAGEDAVKLHRQHPMPAQKELICFQKALRILPNRLLQNESRIDYIASLC